MGELWICGECGGKFRRIGSDADSEAAWLRDFPGADPADRFPVCPHCYEALWKAERGMAPPPSPRAH